ncbi:MAG: S41 family peptidase [Chloroflexota bacterium]
MRKTLVITVSILAALVLLSSGFLGGVVTAQLIPDRVSTALESVLPGISPSVSIDASTITSGYAAEQTSTDSTKLFKPFWQAWNIVHEQYIDQPVNDITMMQGAIQGMMASLGDQHTSYMNPDQYKQMNMSMEGEYEGIGAWVDTTTEYLTIISPMPNSPAEKAGLLPGDKVIKIDDEDMTGIDGSLVVKHILGKAGTTVALTIVREKVKDPFKVIITRARVVVPSVQGKILKDKNIAYIQLYTFGENTTKDLRTEIKKLIDQKPDGMILDLRNNGGGLLTTAIEVGSEFIPKGVVLYEDYGKGKRQTFEAKKGGLAVDIPLVVLINEGSASASEIVAGAIQDHKRGPLVGITSYGKGSVQNWIPLLDSQGAVRVTIARWLTPDEHQINKKGLKPDYEVELTADDFKAKKDPQLDKAVEILLEKKK